MQVAYSILVNTLFVASPIGSRELREEFITFDWQ